MLRTNWLAFTDACQFLNVLDEMVIVFLVVDRRCRLDGDFVARCITVEFNFGAQFEDKLFEMRRGEQGFAFGLIVLTNFSNLLRRFADDEFSHVSETGRPTIRRPIGNAHLE